MCLFPEDAQDIWISGDWDYGYQGYVSLSIKF